MSLQRIPYSYYEDKMLLRASALFDNDWRNKGDQITEKYNRLIAKLNKKYELGYPERPKRLLKQHWTQVVDPSINKKNWDQKEINNLKELYSIHKNDWETIKKELGTNRSTNAIMNMYNRLFKPKQADPVEQKEEYSEEEQQNEEEDEEPSREEEDEEPSREEVVFENKPTKDELKQQLVQAMAIFFKAFELYINCE